MVEQRSRGRPEQLAAEHLRGRRQRGLRRDECHMAVQRVHERVHGRELQERRPHQVGDHLGPLATAARPSGSTGRRSRDPNPPTGAHPIFSGLQHVWRTWAFGAGAHPGAVPQDTTPNIANYEANCPEFTSFGDPRCGDFQPLGGAAGLKQCGRPDRHRVRLRPRGWGGLVDRA